MKPSVSLLLRLTGLIGLSVAAVGFTAMNPGNETPQSLLLKKLCRKEPVTYLGLGDSITYGYELANPRDESFVSQFHRLLSDAFQDPKLRYVNAGVSGDTVSDGLVRLPALLKKYRPDLMTVQFGGNDYRLETPIEEFRRDLDSIVSQARGNNGICVILVTPPMAGDAPAVDASVVKAVREVGEAQGVPVLDADTLLKQSPHDYRGLFPHRAHPTAYSHRQMALLLWDMFARWIRYRSPVSIEIEPKTAPVDGSRSLRICLNLKNASDELQASRVSLFVGAFTQQTEILLRGREQQRVTFAIPLGTLLDRERTVVQSVRACVGTRDGFDCDMRALALNPLAQVVSDPPETAPVHRLDFWNVVVGEYGWDGPDDLSGDFQVQRTADTLRVTARVRDDVLMPARDTSPYDGDSVEVYLDLRKAREQKRPYYTNEMVILYVIPDRWEDGAATVITSEPDPKQLQGAAATWKRTAEGYEVTLDAPMTWFEKHGADAPSAFGFDIVLNDGDDRYGRETQMVWAGSEQDYLNPTLLGALWVQPTSPSGNLFLTIQ